MLKLRLLPFTALGLTAAIALAEEPATSTTAKPAAAKAKAAAVESVPVNVDGK